MKRHEVSIALNVLHEGPSCNTLLFSVGPVCHTRENISFQVFKIQFSIASGQPQCQEKLSASQLLFVSGNFLLIGHPTVNYIAKLRRGVSRALNIIIDFLAELDLPQTEILTREIESTSKNTSKKVNKNTNEKKQTNKTTNIKTIG